MIELICSLSHDVNDRYVGFVYVDGKTIKQLKGCQLVDDKVLHIQGNIREKCPQFTCMGNIFNSEEGNI